MVGLCEDGRHFEGIVSIEGQRQRHSPSIGMRSGGIETHCLITFLEMRCEDLQPCIRHVRNRKNSS